MHAFPSFVYRIAPASPPRTPETAKTIVGKAKNFTTSRIKPEGGGPNRRVRHVLLPTSIAQFASVLASSCSASTRGQNIELYAPPSNISNGIRGLLGLLRKLFLY